MCTNTFTRGLYTRVRYRCNREIGFECGVSGPASQDRAAGKYIERAEDEFADENGQDELEEVHLDRAGDVTNRVRRNKGEKRPSRDEGQTPGVFQTAADHCYSGRLSLLEVFMEAESF